MTYGLEFLRLPRRGGKPRRTGITIVRDYGFSVRQAEDMVESIGEYVDYVKIRQWPIWYQDQELTRRRIQIYRANGITPFSGGALFQLAYSQGKATEAFRALLELGFPALEIGDGIIDISLDEKGRAISQAADAGFEVIFEYGKKYATDVFDVAEAARELKTLLAAGASRIILERSQLDVTLGPDCKGPQSHLLVELAGAVGLEKLIFEAEALDHQHWLIRTFGPEVNLGPNISPEHVTLKLEPARSGIGRDEGWSLLRGAGEAGGT